jgi:hypothetical protein
MSLWADAKGPVTRAIRPPRIRLADGLQSHPSWPLRIAGSTAVDHQRRIRTL